MTDSGWQLDWENFLLRKYRDKSRRTVRQAVQHVHVFALWFESVNGMALEPAQLTSYDLQEYRRHSLQEARVSANTWNNRLWALTLFCDWLGLPLTDSLRRQNVSGAESAHRALSNAERLGLMRQLEISRRGAKTARQYQRFFQAETAIALMLATGLRVDEIKNLRVDDVQISARKGSALVRHGKGDKERRVSLGPVIRAQMSAYLQFRADTAAGETSLFGVTERTLQRWVSDAGDKAGIRGVTPHWLRYTFAKRLEEAGETIELIRDFLGHSSIETTRTYLRSGAEQRERAVSIF